MSEPAPHPRGTQLPTRLARLGLSDVVAAARTVSDLELDGDDETATAVLQDLSRAADPDLALSVAAALAAAPDGGRPFLEALRRHRLFRSRLFAVAGASEGLGAHLSRHPQDWALLDDRRPGQHPLESRWTAAHLRTRLLTAVGADPLQPITWGSGGATASAGWQQQSTLDALRVEYTRGLLAIAARDLTGMLSLEDVTGELADLAAASIDAALAVAAAGLPAGAVPCRFAVIGMGKCGGHELNYVSDVDVIFVAESLDSRGSGGPGGDGTAHEQAAMRTATALATGLIRACSAVAGEGRLFTLDTALRPEGRSGPLVRTLASHEAYYRRWAQSWEMQALLKARPLAGDLALGQAFVTAVAPLVWSASARPDLPGEVQAMRRRVETDLARRVTDEGARRELKLGPGGLRDVEFSVQLLQLVHGRADRTLRSGTTLDALRALAAGGYVGREDAEQLEDAYRWLRAAEHRLQLQRLRRTHSVPTAERELRWLARSLGYVGDARRTAEEAFEVDRRRYTLVVRRLHEKVFYRPLLSAVAKLPSQDTQLTAEAAEARLGALGYADTRAALAHLAALTSGVTRRAAIQRTLLPVMLGWFAEEADPDAGLLAFRRVSDALGDTPWYLRWLRDEGAVAERLAHLLARSRYVADLLTRAPEGMRLLEDESGSGELALPDRNFLVDELRNAVRRIDDPIRAVAVARALRRQELLRVSAADLLGLVPPGDVATALTDSASALVAAALDVAWRTVETASGGELPVRLAVVGMGRLGGGEMSYASDADVLFVHEQVAGAGAQEAAEAARAVAEETRRLLAAPAPDPPLTLDAGLRPEGRSGPLTRSLAAFAAYHASRAQVWEQQALIRAAPLAGDADLAGRFLEQIAPVRWPETLPPEALAEVRRLRDRVLTERAAPGLPARERWRDTKLGPGGVADVEWAVQLLQLRHAHEVEGLRTTSTLGALAAATEAGLLNGSVAAVLEQGWRAATRLRNAVVLVTGRHIDVLPSHGRDLGGVARVAGEDLVDGWRTQGRAVRTAAEAVLESRSL